MDEPLPLDVMARLESDFGNRADAVAALLAARQSGHSYRLNDHLVRCIIWAARGDESKVQQLIEHALQDYRDVILFGEYDGDCDRHVRDLSHSFLIDSPEKFWASGITRVMASRGYRLTSLETRPATVGPFIYKSDSSERRATFIGTKGVIGIEIRDGLWSIHGNRLDLEIHELDREFSDEGAFRDAVSAYLLLEISSRALNQSKEAPPAEVVRQPWWRFWKSNPAAPSPGVTPEPLDGSSARRDVSTHGREDPLWDRALDG
jgi:hypothetical protein